MGANRRRRNVSLTPELMRALRLQVHSELLAIRSSNIAFTMGAKGPLWEKYRLSMVKLHDISRRKDLLYETKQVLSVWS